MFWTRLISGIILLFIAFAAFWIGAPLLPAILYVVSLIGYLELTKVLGVRREGRKGIDIPEIVGVLGITAYYGLLLLRDMDFFEGERVMLLVPCLIFVLLGELFVYVLTFPRYPAEAIAASVFSFLYAPVMLSFIDLTRMYQDGKTAVWLILISSWGCDVCAYCVGKLIGKKKIFPVLSPKKSLEGCIGGMLGAAILGVVYEICLGVREPLTLGMIAIVCGMGAVASMAGDLAASAIKRNKGIKDYGKLIPGHGGVMDRFDSVIVTAPLTYYLLVLLAG